MARTVLHIAANSSGSVHHHVSFALCNSTGVFDRPNPERRRWEAVFPDHRTVLLEGAGHYIQEDAPDEIISAILDWA